MSWQFSPFMLPTFLAAAISAALLVVARRHRDEPMAPSFALLMAGLFVWSLGYGVQLAATSLSAMLFWDAVGFVGSVTAPTAWFLLAARYAGYDDRLTGRRRGLLAVEPLAVLALVWTNDAHRLIWRDAAVGAGDALVPVLTFGPAYWLNFAYSYLLIGLGLLLLALTAAGGARIHRRQSALLVVGAVVPLAVNAAFHVAPALNPMPAVDLTTFAFAISGAVFGIALFRYRILDLVPVARETLFEEMEDGLIVLDDGGRVVDCNPTARRVLGPDPEGRPLGETPVGTTGSRHDEIVTVEAGDATLTYDLRSTVLRDARGREAGRVVVMRDITELRIVREQEQRLDVLNRVLRHNVRNEMNVVMGYADILAESSTGPAREYAETIHEVAGRTVAISEKARAIQSTLTAGGRERSIVDVGEVVGATVAEHADRFPDADVAVDAPAVRAVAAGRDHLATAVANVVENALRHSDRAVPRVRVSVERDGEWVALRVADDGPGVPAFEVASLAEGRETPLEHGSGLGLWLVHWIVEASGGRLSFAENRPRGSVVTIELRPAPDDGDAPAAR